MGKQPEGVSGTKEWAATSENCMEGCGNDCIYCYAKADAIRFKRRTPKTWKDEVVDQAKVDKKVNKRKGTIMFPTTHDLRLDHWEPCLLKLIHLLGPGNKVLVVSKPDHRVIKKILSRINSPQFKSQVLLRFTIGSMDPYTLQFWEPNAPPFSSRLYALMWAFENGWQTSVSMEPMLDEQHVDVMRTACTLAPYVTDAVWLGKANNLTARTTLNFGGADKVPDIVKLKVSSLIESQSDGAIRTLYESVTTHKTLKKKVKFKESIKKVVGIEVPTEAGLDI
jgi:hypothetical protein